MTAGVAAPARSGRRRAAPPARPSPWRVLARVPGWAVAVATYGTARLVTTGLLGIVALHAAVGSRAGAHPSLLALSTAWDGQWYWYLSEHGYPTVLPRTPTGAVDQNTWAFLPLYPQLVKLLSFGVGPLWPITAELVSVAFGFGCAVLLLVLLRPHLGRRRALAGVAVFAFAPLSFVLQTAYAESMGLFLTLAVLCLIDRGRPLVAVPLAVALAFTRPQALPLALAVALHLVVRLVAARRGGPAVPPRRVAGTVVLAVVTAAAGAAWPVIAGAVTGVPDAYQQTLSLIHI